MYRFRLFIAGLFACAILMAAGFTSTAFAHDKREHHHVDPSGKEEGFPLTTAIWDIKSIPTCWKVDEATFNLYSAQREITRKAVTDTWEAVSLVRFTGWGQCVGGNNGGVSIAIVDDAVLDNLEDNPGTYGLGTQMKRNYPSMDLNFEFTSWSADYCQIRKDECNRLIAVHEFGYALGFSHEHNRNNTPAECSAREKPQGTDGDVKFGPWDAESVLNYCNRLSGNGVLSQGDIAMVKHYYGDPDAVVEAPISIFDESGNFLTVVQ
jgi:hypothetical protein